MVKKNMRLSYIIPTIGRPGLLPVISWLRSNIASEDEVIVIGDGIQFRARGVLSLPDWRFKYYEFGPTNLVGNAQRDFGIERASGDFLAFVDDDDIPADESNEVIHAAIDAHPTYRVPHIFGMKNPGGHILSCGHREEVGCGRIGGPMFVPPRNLSMLGKWSEPSEYTSDWNFVAKTMKKYWDKGEDAFYHSEVIYNVLPERRW